MKKNKTNDIKKHSIINNINRIKTKKLLLFLR